MPGDGPDGPKTGFAVPPKWHVLSLFMSLKTPQMMSRNLLGNPGMSGATSGNDKVSTFRNFVRVEFGDSRSNPDAKR